MSERRFPIGVLAVVPVVVGMGVWAFTGQAQVEDPAVQATATANAAGSLTPEPTETAEWWIDSPPQWTPGPTETPWPTPQTSHGAFHDGAWVRVNAGAGDCLNARVQPALEGEFTAVNVCLPHGHEALIDGYTQQADGHWWWFLAGLGWVAEDYLEYVDDFDARANRLPDLAGRGRVAFLRGNDIWVMEADGSAQALLVDNPENDVDRGTYYPAPEGITWSPDGTMLSYQLWRTDEATGFTLLDLHIVSVSDGSERVFESTAGGGWAPDSARLGIIRDVRDYYSGVPAILDVVTGAQLVLGSEPIYQERAPSFNYDGTLLLVHSYDNAASMQVLIVYDADGVEIHRISFGSDAYFASARWSPTQNRVAMHLSEDGDARYVVYDVDAGSLVAERETPPVSDRSGRRGGCGGGDMWRTAWSADGHYVMYVFLFGDTGANGVWAWDVDSGTQQVVIANGVDSPTAGPDGALMFSSGGDQGYIFAGSTAGGLPRILTDGSSPVWHYER